MVHSGSRNLGHKVATYYNKLAQELNEKWFSQVPKKWELAFLPMDSEEGKAYIREMNYCVDFALANRKLMMDRIKQIFKKIWHSWDLGVNDELPGVEFDKMINIAHNYASQETFCDTCIDNHSKDKEIVERLLDVETVTKVQDFLNGYRPVFHSYGGLTLLKGASFLKLSPSQTDALEQMICECRSLNLGLELKHNHFSSFYPYEYESSSEIDKALNISESRFGLGFAHLFGVEKDYHKWDRILGRIFLGYEAYNLDCLINNKYTSIVSRKHNPTQVWVHRKGATLATKDTIGIIPGSMGTKSHIVKGLGNPDSFNSCSHGAGRKMSRTKAKEELNLDEEKEKMKGIIHGIRNIADLDEAPGSYKDINVVMENQKDLVDILIELKPLANIKGE